VNRIANCPQIQTLSDELLLLAFIALAAYAAVLDVRSLRIPNIIPLGITALFAARLLVSLPHSAFAAHAMTAAAAISILFVFYLFGWFGAGDIKLVSAITLWTGPTLGLQFLAVFVIAGGIFAAALLVLAKLLQARPGLAAYVPSHRLREWAERRAYPYALPIFAGALWVLPQLFRQSVCV
jgi:prepilin peptidase CpaA